MLRNGVSILPGCIVSQGSHGGKKKVNSRNMSSYFACARINFEKKKLIHVFPFKVLGSRMPRFGAR
jgi:hypothetical protein